MGSTVLISVRPGRTRAALVENGVLTDLLVFDDARQSLVGNIYLGRVEKVVGHLAAAFVDIGGGVSGFLAAAEARSPGQDATADISACVTEGQAVVVQVQRDGFEDKGPKLTARVVLNGRALILTPYDPGVRLSRRIDGEAERARLETVARDLGRPDGGFILRTAARGLPSTDLAREADALRQAWADVAERGASGTPPMLLSDASNPLLHILRDFTPAGVGRIVIDDIPALAGARAWCRSNAPDLTDRLDSHAGPASLFETVDAKTGSGGDDSVEAALEEALSPSLALPSGGSVLFAETPALIAIDVNVGGAVHGGRGPSVLATNLEAARLIARQIRIRNLSGLLVVDFVSTKNKKDQAKVLEAVKRAVAGDPSNVFVGGFTRFGLLEMTRRRNRPSLASLLMAPCRPCDGHGHVLSALSIAYKALDQLARAADATPAVRLSLVASPAIVAALQGPAGRALAAINERFGRQFPVVGDDQRAADDFQIIYDGGNDHDR